MRRVTATVLRGAWRASMRAGWVRSAREWRAERFGVMAASGAGAARPAVGGGQASAATLLTLRRSEWAVRPLATKAATDPPTSSPPTHSGVGNPSAETAPASADAPSPKMVPVPEVRACPPGEMPDSYDQATGLERLELENPDLFRHNEVIRGPFGTPEAPVQVESAFESRIVGCTGHAVPDDHELMWILVKKGEQCRCPLCDQVFVLKPAE